MKASGRGAIVLAPLLLAGSAWSATPVPEPVAAAGTFLARNCRLCHNPLLKNAGLDLDAYPLPSSLATAPEVWEKVVEKLETRQMPPSPMPGTDPVETAALVGWIQGELERIEAALPPDPGRVTARRLNRTEYDNTVRDLLGVALRPGDAFPHDDAGLRVRQHRRRALGLAGPPGEVPEGRGEGLPCRALRPGGPEAHPHAAAAHGGQDRAQPRGARRSTTRSGLSLPNALHVLHRFPVDAEYLFRIVPTGVAAAGSEPVQIAVFLDGRQIQVVEVDGEGGVTFSAFQQDLTGKTREFRARVAAGEHWVAASVLRLYEGLPASYGGPNPSRRPLPPPPPFRPPENATPEKLEAARKRYEARRSRRRSPPTRRGSGTSS